MNNEIILMAKANNLNPPSLPPSVLFAPIQSFRISLKFYSWKFQQKINIKNYRPKKSIEQVLEERFRGHPFHYNVIATDGSDCQLILFLDKEYVHKICSMECHQNTEAQINCNCVVSNHVPGHRSNTKSVYLLNGKIWCFQPDLLFQLLHLIYSWLQSNFEFIS